MINRRYKLIKKLGQGRSVVYLCEDLLQDAKQVAVKILSSQASEEEKLAFKNEFETIQKLDHPNIIKTYERGTVVEVNENENEFLNSKYISMEYFAGAELLNFPVESEDSLRTILAQICSVLFYFHQSGYIYYDLKPENILVVNQNNKPLIKLIDLGLARKIINNSKQAITGTTEYLAPEILKKEYFDHRIDLYSLGILTYRLIYKKFPFDTTNQLEIYKAHIEEEFYFPPVNYSNELLAVVKKLLNKNPEERYFSSIQVLYDLGISPNDYLFESWLPIKIFSDRTDIINIISRYIKNPSGEVIVVRGFEKSGKTSVGEEIYSKFPQSIFIPNERNKSGHELIKYFLNKLLFNESVFSKLNASTLKLADKIYSNASASIINDLKILVNQVSQACKFIIIIDDINLFESFTLKIFEEIFPILQVNGSSIILFEKSDLEYVTSFINNLVELNLSPFTTSQAEELIENSYAGFFPVNEVKNLVMYHADFLPGNIMEFLRNLVLLKIIRFEYDGIKVVSDEVSEQFLTNLFQEIYAIRFNSLLEKEIELAQLVSAFEIIPERKIILKLLNFSEDELENTIIELKRKNIFHSQSQSGFTFSSEGIKNHIYSKIADKKSYHKRLADQIHSNFPKFNNAEIARHYELCEMYDESFLLLITEADEAEKISALKYKQNILEKLLKMPLKENQKHEVKLKLCTLYHVLNNYKNSYELAEDLLTKDIGNNSEELKIIKGNSLIKLGEIETGLAELKNLLPKVKEENLKTKLILDIAWGELELANYEAAAEIGSIVINNSKTLPEHKGDAFNLLGLISVNHKNDLDTALSNFQSCMNEYKKIDYLPRIAAAEGNIGNIYNMKGNYDEVEKHWNKSLELSTTLGNLSYQALLLMNFGIYHFNRQSFEESIKNYQRAALTFSTIGEKIEYARSETNLGEVYLFICQYQNGINSLKNALEIFRKLRNFLEEAEALFLLAKIYLRIGDYANFSDINSKLNSITATNTLPERYSLHQNLLVCLAGYEKNIDAEYMSLPDIAAQYLRQEDRVNYFESYSLAINALIKGDDLKKANELLNDNSFQSICEANPYMKIERLYLISKLIIKDSSFYKGNAINYLSQAYDTMNELAITETSCKILYQLALLFFDRGNILKAKEYAEYSRALIYYFADQFNEERSKDLYLNSSYRQDALQNLTEIVNSE